jgi:hypothetical protein
MIFVVGIICYTIGYMVKLNELGELKERNKQVEDINEDLLRELKEYKTKYNNVVKRCLNHE